MQAARTAADVAGKATVDRVAAEAPLTGLRQAINTANAAVPARTKDVQAAKLAREAADKVVAAKLPAVQSFAAKCKSAKEAVDALAAEKAASDSTRASAMAPRS